MDPEFITAYLSARDQNGDGLVTREEIEAVDSLNGMTFGFKTFDSVEEEHAYIFE